MTETETVDTLRARLFSLTTTRAGIIEEAKRMVADANKDFDRQAIAINRRIRALTPREEPEPVTPLVRRPSPRRRRLSLVGTAGWTAEDLQHYKDLQLQQL